MGLVYRNGKAFDGGDVVIAIFGSLDYEITEISYDTEQDHQANHSLGTNKMTSYSMGPVNHKATMTMRASSISAIEKAVGGNLLTIKPFDINVSLVNEDNDKINDTITCKFQTQGRDIAGEMDLKKQYTLFVLDINYNNA